MKEEILKFFMTVCSKLKESVTIILFLVFMDRISLRSQVTLSWPGNDFLLDKLEERLSCNPVPDKQKKDGPMDGTV